MSPAAPRRSADPAVPAVETLRVDARALDAAVDEGGAAARSQVEDVLERARRARDPESLAWSLRAMGVVRRHEDDILGAARLLTRARRTAEQAGLVEVEAWALASRSAVELVRGRTSRARHDAETALALTARVEHSPALVELRTRLHLLLAVADHNAGRLGSAAARYRDLLHEVAPGSTNEVRGANNLALVLAEQGSFGEAQERAERAVEVAASMPPLLRSWPYLTRALIEVRTGRLADGLRDLDRAAEACQEAGISPGEYYLEYADTMRELRLLPEAAEAGRRAVDELQRAGAALVEVEARAALAETYLMMGDVDAAADAGDEARDLARAQGRRAVQDRAVVAAVQARWNAGRARATDLAAARRAARRLHSSGQVAAATDAYLVAGRMAQDQRGRAARDLRDAAEVARRSSLTVRVRGRVAAALEARLHGADDRVLAACRAGLRDLARHRQSLPTMELRAMASGHGAELGELGLEVVLRRGSPAGVLRWMEQTRAAALLVRTPAAQVPTKGASVRGASEGQEQVRDVAPPRRTRHVLVADDARAVDARREAWMRDVQVPSTTAVASVAELRRALGGRVLVEYGRSRGRLVAVVVEARRMRTVDLGAAEGSVVQVLRALVFALRRLGDPRGDAAAEAARASADLRLEQLRQVLLQPLAVDPTAELVLVPVGHLHGVPWSALHAGPVALAPSATAWLRTCTVVPRRTGEVVLVAGPGLRGAQGEVDALAGLHEEPLVLGEASSTATDVVAAVTDADLAHLACHGVLRSDNPMFSSVVLADGPVTVEELHRHGVAPRRLVLASCHSGADVAYAGDEVLGFVSTMLEGGTSGVVASIAAVPDVEVVDLMVGLHRRLAAGETMARALHGARGEIDRSTPAGFVNWCTFSAHGAG